MKEEQMQEGAQDAPRFPFEEIEIRLCRTEGESQALIDRYVAQGGTGETLLEQIKSSKSPILLATLFADHHLPILSLIPDFSEFGKPAIYCAAANESDQLLGLLLERGADPYLKMQGLPALVVAAYAQSERAIACVERLLDAGVDIDVASDHGMTALMRAAGAGNVDMARRLLAAGADVSRRDSKGCTALHWAMGYGASELGDKGVPSGCVEVARLLLESGAVVDARDFTRKTPLHHLARTRGWEPHDAGAAIDLLVRHGADIEARGDGGSTPIMLAAFNSTSGGFLIGQLHRAGADMNAKDAEGRTIDQQVTGEGPQRALRAIRMGQNLDAAMADGGMSEPAPARGLTL